MDDDEMGCDIPDCVQGGRAGDHLYCHTLILLAQLSSSAKKRLSSAKALRQTPDQLIQTVHDLNTELENLKATIDSQFDLAKPVEPLDLPDGISVRQAQLIQCYYFCLVLDVNTPLVYPWTGIGKYTSSTSPNFAQVKASCEAVAQVSRTAILATRYIHVDASCPSMSVLR